MKAILVIAAKELRLGMRNRWVIAATLLLAALAFGLALLGSAPTGTIGAGPVAVTVVSLASLSIFLIPLIALLLSHDAVVGELERGTLLLLLTYPARRWQILLGKFLGHCGILAIAILVGYGAVGLLLAVDAQPRQPWSAFGMLLGSSVLLGGVFVSLGYLVSAAVRSRGAAAGLALAIWLVLVVLFDLVLLGLLVQDKSRQVSPEVFPYLLLANPTDVYRLLNLTGFDTVRAASGMMGLEAANRFSSPQLLGALCAWVVLPLGASTLVFSRKEI